jgi:hypothetical protein
MDVAKLSTAAETAISQLLEQVPEEPLAEAVGGFLRALLSGLEGGDAVRSCAFCREERRVPSLSVRLNAAVIGSIATRSRIPTEWLLQPELLFSIEEDGATTTSAEEEGGGGVRLRLSGVQVVPLEGARRAWRAISARFAASAADTLDARRTVAWEWWDTEGRAVLDSTKLWRVVESLAGLGFGKAAPAYAKASLLLGCSLSLHQNVTTLDYRYVGNHYRHHDSEETQSSSNGRNSHHRSSHGKKTRHHRVHVKATMEPCQSTYDPTSPDFNCHRKIQKEIGDGLWEEMASSSVKRQIAAKCATSSLNYAALFCAREGERGASPASVQKLVTAARHFGGATNFDIMRGKASAWQVDDETYQMTAGDGRVVWRWLEDENLRRRTDSSDARAASRDDQSVKDHDDDAFLDTYEKFSEGTSTENET